MDNLGEQKDQKWPVVELDEIINMDFGTRITKKNEEGTKYPVYGGGGESFRTDTFNREDEMVISRFAMSENCVRFVRGKFFMLDSGFTFSIKPERESEVLKEYIGKYLLSIQPKIYACARGHAQKNLDTKAFKAIKIPLPPIEVQKEIVEQIEVKQSAIEHAKAIIENLERERRYFARSLGEVERVKLGEIGKISMCKRVFKQQTSAKGDIPFFKIGTFGGEPDAYISRDMYEEYIGKYSAPKKGDVLLSTSGTIGRVVIFDGKPAYFQDSNIVWIDNDEQLVLNKYLYYVFQSIKWITTKGGTIERLYNKLIEETRIPVPSLEVQKQMVEEMEKEEEIIASNRKLIDVMEKKISGVLSTI